MARDLGPRDPLIAAGREEALQGWLAERVWPQGRSVTGAELVAQLSGRPLEAGPFLTRLRRKLEELAEV